MFLAHNEQPYNFLFICLNFETFKGVWIKLSLLLSTEIVDNLDVSRTMFHGAAMLDRGDVTVLDLNLMETLEKIDWQAPIFYRHFESLYQSFYSKEEAFRVMNKSLKIPIKEIKKYWDLIEKEKKKLLLLERKDELLQ